MIFYKNPFEKALSICMSMKMDNTFWTYYTTTVPEILSKRKLILFVGVSLFWTKMHGQYCTIRIILTNMQSYFEL